MINSIKDIKFITKEPTGWLKFLYCKEHQYRLPTLELYLNAKNNDLTISRIE